MFTGRTVESHLIDAMRDVFGPTVGVSASTSDFNEVVREGRRQVLPQQRDRPLIPATDHEPRIDVFGDLLDEPGNVFSAALPTLFNARVKPFRCPAAGTRLVQGPRCDVPG